jgi:hypothetical protein
MVLASLGLAASLLLRVDPQEQPVGVSAADTPIERQLQELVVRPDRWEFDLAARLELRAGQQDGSTPGTALVDLEIDPVLAVRGPLRTGSLTLAYEPRIFITLNQVPGQSSNSVSYLHRGHFILDLKPTPLWRWFIETRTAYGEYDFSPLSTVIPQTGGILLPPSQPTLPGAPPVAPVPVPGVSTLPDQRYIQVVDIDGSTGVVAALSPRVSWLLSVGYTYSGGANAAAQTQIPLQKGPKGATGAIWSVTPNDNTATLLTASQSTFSSGPESVIGTLTQSWSHVWSRTTATDLIGGVGGFHSSVPAQGTTPARTENKVLPVAGVGLRESTITRSFDLRNSIAFLAAPLPDQINGFVYERLSLVTRSSMTVGAHFLFDLSAGVSASISAPQRDARIEAKGTYMLSPQFGVSVGGRVAWLQGSDLLPTGFGWVCLLSIGTYLGSPLVGPAL